MTRPLLFSLLIILASFLPVFFLGEREARLFDPLAYSKTFAMAFSTLLTLFLLPIVIVWIFKRDVAPARLCARASSCGRIGRAAVDVIATAMRSSAISAVLVVDRGGRDAAGFQKDFMPEMDEGSILYMPTTLPGLPTREAGWIVQQMDKKLKALPGSRAGLRQARPGGHVDRPGAGRDDRDDGAAEAAVRVAAGHDQGQADRRDGQGDVDRRLRQQLGAADQRARHDAGHRHPDAGRHQGEGPGSRRHRAGRAAGRGAAARLAGHRSRSSPSASRRAITWTSGTTSSAWPSTVSPWTRRWRPCATPSAATTSSASGRPDKTVVPLSVQYSPEYIDTLDKVRNTPVVTDDGRSVPLGDVADVAVREAPEMIRNDNGKLAGYIYVDLRDITGPDYVERARAVSRART